MNSFWCALTYTWTALFELLDCLPPFVVNLHGLLCSTATRLSVGTLTRQVLTAMLPKRVPESRILTSSRKDYTMHGTTSRWNDRLSLCVLAMCQMIMSQQHSFIASLKNVSSLSRCEFRITSQGVQFAAWGFIAYQSENCLLSWWSISQVINTVIHKIWHHSSPYYNLCTD